MKIILSEKVLNLGEKGNIVDVKPGYARNFLFPNRKAILANKENIKKFNEKRILSQKIIENKISFFHDMKIKLDNLKKIRIFAKSSKDGKLFGSVNSKIIVHNLKKIGIIVNKKNVYIENNFIKKLGTYNVLFKLHKNIKSNIYIEILPK
ncbi:50S ribosomal protein L9 [Buchnera aphidicola (Pseudoregma panicola)]|uniref:50S ribosomal protein L9 n=1 Tax=Buchnera aphidicola TaxID=9 RepID=UPI0031B699A6